MPSPVPVSVRTPVHAVLTAGGHLGTRGAPQRAARRGQPGGRRLGAWRPRRGTGAEKVFEGRDPLWVPDRAGGPARRPWSASASARTWLSGAPQPGRARHRQRRGPGGLRDRWGPGLRPDRRDGGIRRLPHVPPPLAARLKMGMPGPAGRPGGRDVVLYQKEQDGLRWVRVVAAASFVRLHGRRGFPCQSRDGRVPDPVPVAAEGRKRDPVGVSRLVL